MKEVTLPLPREMRRCMGFGYAPNDGGCPRRDWCARHTTMQEDSEPWEIKPWYRLCDWRETQDHAMLVPVEGYMTEEPEA